MYDSDCTEATRVPKDLIDRRARLRNPAFAIGTPAGAAHEQNPTFPEATKGEALRVMHGPLMTRSRRALMHSPPLT